MDFSFTEEQQAVEKLAGEIFTDFCEPDKLKLLEQQRCWFDQGLWSALAEAGLLGLAIPEKYGGQGLGIIETCVLLERQGWAVAPVPLLDTLASGVLTLLAHAEENVLADFLPAVAKGELVLSAALSETSSDDPRDTGVTAVKDGENWRLDGSKQLVGAGQHAARILVPARVDGQGQGLFLLDPAGSGVILGEQEATSGEIRSSLDLSGALVDHRSALGPADGKAVADLVRFSLAGLCATEAGVVARAVRMTADYTSTREQFGKPVASFQAVAQRAADAFVDLEAIKLATWYAVSCLDRGEAADEALAVAKYWASEGGHSAVYACQHLHGGTGVDNDYPLHRYYLWSKQIELTLGGAEFHLASLGKMLAAG